eukprot:m.256328 g.256328  ORF g.256328 m.256328 type:complete len:668 (-) comp15517_c0_seq3:326-2329(-)
MATATSHHESVPVHVASMVTEAQLSKFVEATFVESLCVVPGYEILRNVCDQDDVKRYSNFTSGISGSATDDLQLREMRRLLMVLRQRNIAKVEGIFRVPGKVTEMNQLHEAVANGLVVDYFKYGEEGKACLLANFLKQLISNWDQAPLQFKRLPVYNEIMSIENEERKLLAMQWCMLSEPFQSRQALKEIIGALHYISSFAEDNMMPPHNLAKCISQCLFCFPEDEPLASLPTKMKATNALGEYLIQTGPIVFEIPTNFESAMEQMVHEETMIRAERAYGAKGISVELETSTDERETYQAAKRRVHSTLDVIDAWREKYDHVKTITGSQAGAKTEKQARERLVEAIQEALTLISQLDDSAFEVQEVRLERELASLRNIAALAPSVASGKRKSRSTPLRAAAKAISRLTPRRSKARSASTSAVEVAGRTPLTISSSVEAAVGQRLFQSSLTASAITSTPTQQKQNPALATPSHVPITTETTTARRSRVGRGGRPMSIQFPTDNDLTASPPGLTGLTLNSAIKDPRRAIIGHKTAATTLTMASSMPSTSSSATTAALSSSSTVAAVNMEAAVVTPIAKKRTVPKRTATTTQKAGQPRQKVPFGCTTNLPISTAKTQSDVDRSPRDCSTPEMTTPQRASAPLPFTPKSTRRNVHQLYCHSPSTSDQVSLV